MSTVLYKTVQRKIVLTPVVYRHKMKYSSCDISKLLIAFATLQECVGSLKELVFHKNM